MSLTVAAVQFAPAFGRIDDNADTVLALMAKQRADLYVVPELPFTGYAFRDRAELERLAEDPQRSRTVERLIRFCRRRGCAVVTGFTESAPGGIFNSALFLTGDGIEATYRKLHLFANEKSVFDEGDLPLPVIPFDDAQIGMMVCFDWAFPEAMRTLALKGADIVCQPANLVLDKCQRAMYARSVENRLFTVTANRNGADRRPHVTLAFTGLSQILGPDGEARARADAEGQTVIAAAVDVVEARNKMITATNDVLADRRPAYYRMR